MDTWYALGPWYTSGRCNVGLIYKPYVGNINQYKILLNYGKAAQHNYYSLP